MSRYRFIAITSSTFVIVTLVACSLAGAPVAVPNQTPTVPVEMQVAEALASTAAVQTGVAKALAATLTAMATAMPVFTFTASFTPSAAFTVPPAFPTVSVPNVTNCRTGPSTVYKVLGVLNVGENAEVVGRSSYSDTLIIKLPSNPSIACWLWSQQATVVGDISGLPLINPPPSPTLTPTPYGSFNVAYVSTITCNGEYELRFNITNTGGITWASNRVKATDQVTNEKHSTAHDDFANVINGCSVVSDNANLAPGEGSITMSGGFSMNPAGHGFLATITVCSQDGLEGTCLEKTFTFTS